MKTLTRDPRLIEPARLFREYVALDVAYQSAIGEALAKYGRHGPLVSGVIRNHFPEAVKGSLRELNRAKNECLKSGFASKPKHVRMSTMVKLLRAIEKEYGQ